MFRLFLIANMFAFFLFSMSVVSDDDVPDRIRVSNSPDHNARKIYIGSDDEMPTDGPWRISINPTLDGDRPLIPESVRDALRELEKALPSWYIVSLRESSGQYECIVSVNNFDLNLLVGSWLWVNWDLERSDTELRQEIEGFGFDQPSSIRGAIHSAFCHFVKYGEDEAIRLLRKGGDAS